MNFEEMLKSEKLAKGNLVYVLDSRGVIDPKVIKAVELVMTLQMKLQVVNFESFVQMTKLPLITASFQEAAAIQRGYDDALSLELIHVHQFAVTVAYPARQWTITSMPVTDWRRAHGNAGTVQVL